jgi:hypothetical protein
MDIFAEAGMARSNDFIEQLAVIIDCHAHLPELLAALADAHALCVALLRVDRCSARELGVPEAQCAEIERSRTRIRRALAQVAAKAAEVMRLVGETPEPEDQPLFGNASRA